MSLVPYLLSDLLEPQRILDQNFGLGLLADDLIAPTAMFRMPSYYRPWRHLRGADSGTSNIVSSDTEFKVNLDVQQFQPEEISVKMVDNAILIEGKHEERRDEHGFVSRQFQRRYVLPDNVDPKGVESQLSSDGVLIIRAPKKMKEVGNERKIPIVQTQQPAVQQKQPNQQNEIGSKMEQ